MLMTLILLIWGFPDMEESIGIISVFSFLHLQSLFLKIILFYLNFVVFFVVKVFSSFKLDLVPWQLRCKWLLCIMIILNISFVITHMHIEDNSCAIFFSSLNCISTSFILISSLPIDIRSDYVKNKLKLLLLFRFGFWPKLHFCHVSIFLKYIIFYSTKNKCRKLF